jgi:heme/copper-type cytochrome/quinol oxidase subunit 3
VRRYDEGRFYLPDAQEGRRETLITSALDARPVQVQRLPEPSALPMMAAAALGGLFILPTFGWYAASAASGAICLVVVLYWLWTGTSLRPEAERKDIGLGVSLPLHAAGPQSIGWWAIFIAMTGSSTAFASLVFAYFYYWTIHPQWPPADQPPLGLLWPLLAAGAIIALWVGSAAARRFNDAGRPQLTMALLVLALVGALAGAAALMLGPLQDGLDPASHPYPAMVFVLSGWSALHLAGGAVMMAYVLARSVAGHITPEHDGDLWNATLFIHFSAPTALLTLAVLHLFPRAG